MKARSSFAWLSGVLAVAVLPLGARAQKRQLPEVLSFPEIPSETPGDVLRVLTLNLAHGRADGIHQLFQRNSDRERTLTRIAALIRRERPHLVAVQEADGPSFWSGGFCHVTRLARLAGFRWAAHGEHVSTGLLRNGVGLHYGTGILSRMAISDPLALTFDPTPPTFSKGFTRSTVVVGDREVDVVSVHLDFASAKSRRKQVDQMEASLAGRHRPLVVMGDFNSGWNDRDSAVRTLAERLRLRAWAPEQPEPRAQTFPRLKSRLDWILVSDALEFERHEVLDDVVSDHLPVMAELRWR